jgi:long-chain acyl-CoA synthetase
MAVASITPLRWETHYGSRRVRCFAERPATLDAMFLEGLARGADRAAIICGPERLSYVQLEHRVERIAANLTQRGLKKGDRLALLVGNAVPFITTTLAAARLGVILVPLNQRQRRPEIQFVLNDCTARMIIVDAECLPNLPPRQDVPALEAISVVGECSSTDDSFASLLTECPGSPPADIEEEDAFCVLYTSGTTGRPKGAVLTHLGVIHSVLHYECAMNLGPHEVSVLAVPASHVTGLVAILLTMIRTGGCTVLMKAFKAREFLRLAAQEHMTHTLMVPAMYNLCLLEDNFSAHALCAWRIGGFGGAPMPERTIEQLAEKLPQLRLVNVYGSTETTSPVTLLRPGDGRDHFDTVGTALPCTDLKIVDENGVAVAPGVMGELWVGGPMVIPGYWRNDAATADAFVEGYWRSGDIGSVDVGGYVRINDRKKDVINRGGYKIYSIEVENVLMAHGDVTECAIVGRPDPILGERVHAFIVPARSGCDLEALREFCEREMSDYKIPETFTLLNEPLPRNANGKILKSMLRQRLEIGRHDLGAVLDYTRR